MDFNKDAGAIFEPVNNLIGFGLRLKSRVHPEDNYRYPDNMFNVDEGRNPCIINREKFYKGNDKRNRT